MIEMFHDITDALNWVMSRRKGDMPFSSFQQIMKELGDPQDDFQLIHVAGTDGKGSTVTYLRDLLMSQGFHVGTLQSPHYETHLDRIRFDGKNIPEEAFLRLLNRYYDLFIEKDLGMFEIDYIIMCVYFKEVKADVVITEVGIGGRLDSTNVVHHPLLSIITTIGYDHMDRLGNTLEDICREKCGIIKDHGKVLVGELETGLRDIAYITAMNKNSSFYELKPYREIKDRTFTYRAKTYHVKSFGKYQYHNASLALEALRILQEDLDFTIDQKAAEEAVMKTIWKGRFEVVEEDPLIILDGAHNVHGMASLLESVDALKGRKLILFSALRRKEYKKMLKEMKGHCERLVVTSFSTPGAIKREDAEGYEFCEDYVSFLKENKKNYDVIIICGSLYFISEIASLWRKEEEVCR